MSIPRISLLVGSALLALAGPLAASAADEGAKIFEGTCAGCHAPGGLTLDDKHLTRAEWKENIDRMVEMNRIDPPLKKDQYEKLLDWLVATHGPGTSPTTDPANAKK
jgi:mono/diheme cytochrome c family protein